MKNPKLLRQIAMYGISLPSFAASPAVAKATVYMPSHIAARTLGGTASQMSDINSDRTSARGDASSSDAPHAA